MSTIKFTTIAFGYEVRVWGTGALRVDGKEYDHLSPDVPVVFSRANTILPKPNITTELTGNITRFASNKGLKELVISKDSELEYIDLQYSSFLDINSTLHSLDVSGLSKLKTVRCTTTSNSGLFEHGLKSLNVNGCSSLETLYCSNNSLTNLDVSGLAGLKTLDCSKNRLKELKMNGCISLEVLNCSQNQLKSLDLIRLSALTIKPRNLNGKLRPSLKDFGIIKNPHFAVGHGSLADVYIFPRKGRSVLKNLNCSNNLFETLDISSCLYLETLNCKNNTFKTLELKSASLREIICGNNSLEIVNLLGCIKLEKITYYLFNQTAVDLSAHDQFKYLKCVGSPPYLNISGCSLLEIIQFTPPYSRDDEIETTGCVSLKEISYSKL